MQDLWAKYRDEWAVKKKSGREDKRLWRSNIEPVLGDRQVRDITASDISKLHTEIGKGAEVCANRTLSLLKTMFEQAEVWGMRKDYSNPCRRIKPYKETPRTRRISEAELFELEKAYLEIKAEGRHNPCLFDALDLLFYTGMRRSEAVNLQWGEVDLERRELRLRDSKTGPKVVPGINTQAEAVLAGRGYYNVEEPLRIFACMVLM